MIRDVIIGTISAIIAFAMIGYCQGQDEQSAKEQSQLDTAIMRGDAWREMTVRGCEIVDCNQIKNYRRSEK